MAVTTFREACHHAGRVRYTVTALTGWYRLVLIFMTGNAQYSFVFGIAAGKHLERALMAGGTHLVRRIRCHEHRCRHMGLVAFFAFGGHHVRAMRLMTLGTKRNLAMNIVAETASQTAMLTLNLFQLDDLLGMAGQALVSDVVCQLDDFRGMWVIVAT